MGTGALVVHEDWVEVAKMGVRESVRGQGVGRAILLELLRIAAEKGWDKAFIASNRSLAPALGLYQSVGFVESTVDRHSGYSRGDITLECAL